MAATIVLLATMPALANGCEPTTSPTWADAAGFYVVGDPCGTKACVVPFTFWIYQETNGIPGLQRWDDVDNTCGGQIEGDTIIF